MKFEADSRVMMPVLRRKEFDAVVKKVICCKRERYG
jgi:hypothetical protein